MGGHSIWPRMAKPVTRRAQRYVRPRGMDAQVKEETNAVLPCHAPDPRRHAPLNGLVEGPESAVLAAFGLCRTWRRPQCLWRGTNAWPSPAPVGVDLHVVRVV